MKQHKTYLVSVSLYLYGDELNPKAISDLLRIKPTRAHSKGDRIVGKVTGREVVTKTGLWSLQIKSNDTTDISIVVDELLSKLNTVCLDLSELPNVSSALFDIFAATDVNPATEWGAGGGLDWELAISPLQIAKIAKLNVPISITATANPSVDETKQLKPTVANKNL
jgi:hypothetical protein